MGVSALDTIRGTLSNMSRIVNSSMDTQPTIRPVLDLSDISSGASAINGMLSMNPSVGVLSNVRSINAMMNGQNRTEDNTNKLISAVKGIKSSGDTYIIDGVTYDDGSNITEAVKTIVRAARVERRA
jgi:hypothetical protein